MSKPTCFVIMGFGVKPDYPTGRNLDLDKTFKNIIEPVFSELGFLCFRAADIPQSGVIDVAMYENIVKSDFVLADLSTSNPNALYELGIRHAVRPHTTIVIAEKNFKNPFDLNHVLIDNYEHLESDIGFDEVMRFRKLLKDKVLELQKSPKTDSPLYTFLPMLKQPSFTEQEIKEIQEDIDDSKGNSLSDLISAAEEAKNEKNYSKAINLLNAALMLNKDDEFIRQRLALATYYSEAPNKVEALENALRILEPLELSTTTNPETIGLVGAIYKRLFFNTNSLGYLDKSLSCYERGFYIKQDYYNGINLAYLHNLKSFHDDNYFDAITDLMLANRIRRNVIEICNSLISNDNFEKREDKYWIYLTLAEAYYGLGQSEKLGKIGEKHIESQNKYEEKAFESAPEFAKGSYRAQINSLDKIIDEVLTKYKLR